jgi:uncharacterized protein YidB (DUF937 family)
MNLFDQLKGILGDQHGEAGSHNLLESAMGMLSSPQIGGVEGLMKLFSNKGLADTISSWISTGKNLPISAEQLKGVLGNEYVQQLAEKIGIPHEAAANGLAALLPQVVDSLTPDGKVPDGGNNLMEQGLDLLKNQLFGSKS